MADVAHEHRSDLVAYLAEPLEIYYERVRRVSADDEFGFLSDRPLPYVVVIERFGFLVDRICARLEPFPGEVDRRAVREMAAVGEVQAHELVSDLQEREECGYV